MPHTHFVTYYASRVTRFLYNPSVPPRTFQLRAPEGLWPLTWPMGLTMLRLLLLPLFLWLVLIDAGSAHPIRPHRWWAMSIFALMAATDKLDGYLARRLCQTSHLGTILDPLADKLLIVCSTILLSFNWVATPGCQIPIPVVAVVYAKDLIVAVGAVALLARVGKVTIQPRLLGKLSTVLQLALVIVTLVAPDLEAWLLSLGLRSLRFLWWAVSLVTAAACADYVGQGLRQLKEGSFHQRGTEPQR